MGETRVIVFDTTLRDGEQAPGCSMSVDEKLRMARQLDELGVDVMEAGFPIASDGDLTAVKLSALRFSRPMHCRSGPRQRTGHRARLGGAGDAAAAAHSCFSGDLRPPSAMQAEDHARSGPAAG